MFHWLFKLPPQGTCIAFLSQPCISLWTHGFQHIISAQKFLLSCICSLLSPGPSVVQQYLAIIFTCRPLLSRLVFCFFFWKYTAGLPVSDHSITFYLPLLLAIPHSATSLLLKMNILSCTSLLAACLRVCKAAQLWPVLPFSSLPQKSAHSTMTAVGVYCDRFFVLFILGSLFSRKTLR